MNNMNMANFPSDDAARAELAKSDADIRELLKPKRGVAFVGSARVTPGARLQFKRYGDVPIYIVNPKGGDAGDIAIVPDVMALPDEVDLVIIRIAPAAAIEAIRQCGQRGIRNVLVFTDGFSETGPAGAALEAELAEAIKTAGVRVVGPNTNDNAFERFPVPSNHRGGEIALITQSGANGRSVVEGVHMGAAFHRWVTTGNEVDLDVSDFIHHFAGLPEVAVIALYVEGFKSAAKLRVALERAVEAGKPVVAIKMGATERGARSAASHTGHLTGTDEVIKGLFRQYGVTRVHDIDELLEVSNLFAKIPLTAESRCAMYTVSGGTAALMAENADFNGLEMPENSTALQEEIYQHLPRNLSVRNPVDNGGAFLSAAAPESRRRVLDLVASNPEVDLVVIGFNAAYGPLSDSMAEDLLAWAPSATKPVVAVWSSILTDTPGYRALVASGVPIFRSFGKCMRGLAARGRYLRTRASFSRHIPAVRSLTSASTKALNKSGVLSAAETATLLNEFGIHLAQERLTRSPAEAARAASEIGFPVVVKLVSADIPHKTEEGLVQLGVSSAKQVEQVAQKFLDHASTLVSADRIEGVLIQEQVPPGVEFIIGLSQDPQFGPTLTLGAGGIYAEIFRDAASLPLPATADDIRKVIEDLRVSKLLDGVRGAPAANREALVKMALAVAELGLSAAPLLTELDLNPVIALPDRAVAVDFLAVSRAN